jgi:deoxyribonuclease (pyrimidine dimer)
MTRINCVDPQTLHVKHLCAEYREIPRIFALVRKHVQSGKTLSAPSVYTLGTGHVKFFYDKLGYISDRYSSLIDEMKRRKYNPSFTNNMRIEFGDIPVKYWKDWTPTPESVRINSERILERMPK